MFCFMEDGTWEPTGGSGTGNETMKNSMVPDNTPMR